VTGWNKRINHWLKFYVYTRVSPPSFLKGLLDKKMFANVCTKFTSAFWHGFYPGYYLFFLCAVLVGLCDDEYHRITRRFFYKDEKDAATGKTVSTPVASPLMRFVYHFAAFCQIHFTLNYFAMAFILLEFDKSVQAWNMISHVGAIYVVVFLALGKVLFPSKRPKKTDASASAASPAATVAAVASASSESAPAAPETPTAGPASRTRSRKAD
jgi:lysophospholipid acyltransferase